MKLLTHIFTSHPKTDGNFFWALKKILGFAPKHLSIYQKAFLHRSANQKDADGTPINYERLEFLGDAVLGAIISKHLYQEVPDGDEGYLTKMRAKVVSRKHLNQLGKELDLLALLQSRIPKAHFSDNIYGNIFEALIGAIYLDRGHNYCEKFITQKVIAPHIAIEALEGKIISYKSLLIEWCQKQKKPFAYKVYEDTGNEPLKHFAVELTIGKKVVAKARATSKKKAEEKASKRAYFALQRKIEKQ